MPIAEVGPCPGEVVPGVIGVIGLVGAMPFLTLKPFVAIGDRFGEFVHSVNRGISLAVDSWLRVMRVLMKVSRGYSRPIVVAGR
jgi:hypothetical protein